MQTVYVVYNTKTCTKQVKFETKSCSLQHLYTYLYFSESVSFKYVLIENTCFFMVVLSRKKHMKKIRCIFPV